MRILDFAARNLIRRRARSALTCAGIAIAVGGFVALIGLAGSLKTAWRNAMSELESHLVVFERQTFDFLSGSLPESYRQKIAAIPGIEAVAAQLVKYAPIGEASHVLVIGWNVEASVWRLLTYESGRAPQQTNEPEVVLGEALARNLKVNVGGHVSIMFRRFRVVGVARFRGVMNNHAAYMLLPVLQKLLNRGNTVTLFAVTTRDPRNAHLLNAIKAKIVSISPQLDVADSEVLVRENSVIDLFESIAWATSVIALAIGLLAVMNTMLMSVAERETEIGTLRALGWSKRAIIGLILLEGTLIALLGALIGCIAGRAGMSLISEFPSLKGLLEVRISFWELVAIFFAMSGLGALGGLYPAWKASRSNPEHALRSV